MAGVPDEQVGECVEHVWVIRGVTAAKDGASIEHECARCGAPAFEGPDEVAGRV